MPTTAEKINHIVHQIEELDYKAQLLIMEETVRLLRNKADVAAEPANKEPSPVTAAATPFPADYVPSLLDLKGLGKEIWQDESVDEYLRKERDSWD